MIGLSFRNVGFVGSLSAEPKNPAYQILIKTDNSGTSNSDQFTLPATGSYTIDWGDGVVESKSGAQTHTYPAAGNYVIKITGGLTRINFNNGGDRLKLLEIQNWGDIKWENVQNAYRGCANMIGTFTDAPDFSSSLFTRNFGSIFRGCTNFNTPINNWDVGLVESFTLAFEAATSFNQPLNNWDLSYCRVIDRMFTGADAFTQSLADWNITAVSNAGTGAFISNNWGTANYNAALIAWADLPDTPIEVFTGVAFTDAVNLSGTIRATTDRQLLRISANSSLTVEDTTNYNGDYQAVSGLFSTPTDPNATFFETTFVSNESGTLKHRRTRNLSINFGTNKYSSGAPLDARNILTSTYGWTVTDGGQE